jgi:hypothetical protein
LLSAPQAKDGRNAGGCNRMVDTSAHQRPPQRFYGRSRQPEKPVTQLKGNTVPLT